MLPPYTISIGILFNALASAIVALSALALAVFLAQRHQRLTVSMRSYAWFWATTVFVWFFSSLRYLIISFGGSDSAAHTLDVAIQIAVFMSGPPLFYYLGNHLLHNKFVAMIMTGGSVMLGLIGVWFLVQTNGLIMLGTTFFSSESKLNDTSLLLFNLEAGIIFILLLVDIVTALRRWRVQNKMVAAYEALYAGAVIVYLTLGSIEQSGLITDWVLVIFRLLYTASFLSVYILVIEHEASIDTYLVDTTNQELNP